MPPSSSGKGPARRPASAILRMMSIGNVSSSRRSRMCGRISRSAKRLAVAWTIRWASDSCMRGTPGCGYDAPVSVAEAREDETLRRVRGILYAWPGGQGATAMGPELLRVYVVAMFEPLHAGLASAISEAADMKLAGAASSLDEMASDDAYREADVIVMDVQAINRSQVPLFYQRIGEWMPSMKMLFLGTELDARAISPDDIPTYMGLHTIGFIQMEGSVDRLLQAIRLVASGSFVCESEVI